MFFTDLPETAGVRVGGHTLEHERGRPVRKRAVDNIAVAGDPAHVRRAPEDVPVVIVEDILVGHGGVDKITAGGVHNALGLAGGAGRVENEEWVFCAHLFRRAIGRRLGFQVVIPMVTTGFHRDIAARALNDQHLGVALDLGKGLVGVGLQWRVAAAARGFVRSDDDLALALIHPCGERVGGEASEDDGVNGADPGAGQHRIGGFRDHRQIKHHPVALADAHALEHVRELRDFAVELFIGDELRRRVWIVWFPDDRRLVAARGKVTVDAIGRNVQRAVFEPADIDIAGRE